MNEFFFRLSPSFFLFFREEAAAKLGGKSLCIIVRPARAFNTHTHTHFNTLTRTETLKVRFKRHALGGGEYCLTSNFTAVFVIFVHVVRKRERITSIRLVTSVGSHPSLSRIPLRFEARAISTTRRDDADDETNLFYFFLNRVVLKAKRSYNNNNKAKEKKKKFVDSRRRSFRERKKKKK